MLRMGIVQPEFPLILALLSRLLFLSWLCMLFVVVVLELMQGFRFIVLLTSFLLLLALPFFFGAVRRSFLLVAFRRKPRLV